MCEREAEEGGKALHRVDASGGRVKEGKRRAFATHHVEPLAVVLVRVRVREHGDVGEVVVVLHDVLVVHAVLQQPNNGKGKKQGFDTEARTGRHRCDAGITSQPRLVGT